MSEIIDLPNSSLVRVNKQLDELSEDGLYIDSYIDDLSCLAFAFPDISDGVINFTLEESGNRKNWGFFACVQDNSENDISFYAKCKSSNNSCEIVARAIEPQVYYIYNRSKEIAVIDLNNRKLFVNGAYLASIVIQGTLNLYSKPVLKSNDFEFQIPILSMDAQKSVLDQWWETITMRWLKDDTNKNQDLVFPTFIQNKVNCDEEIAVFMTLLLFRTFSILD